MKDENVKQVVLRRRGKEKVNGESKRGSIWLRHFLYMYEYGSYFKKGCGGRGRIMEEINQTGVQICTYKNICHSETHCIN
jgi:hypothetical protein